MRSLGHSCLPGSKPIPTMTLNLPRTYGPGEGQGTSCCCFQRLLDAFHALELL